MSPRLDCPPAGRFSALLTEVLGPSAKPLGERAPEELTAARQLAERRRATLEEDAITRSDALLKGALASSAGFPSW